MEKFNEIIELNIDEVVPNNWNPNTQQSQVFNELVSDISEEGFDEPIRVVKIDENDELYKDGKRYRIIDGEHRWRAVRINGFDKIMAVVKDYNTEEEQKVKTVRKNMLKGELDRPKFAKLVKSLDKKNNADELSRLMALNENNSKKLKMLFEGRKKNRDIDNIRKEKKAIEGLSVILNKLIEESGDTIPNGFMFFTFRKKVHLMVTLDRWLRDRLNKIVEKSKKENIDINKLLRSCIARGQEEFDRCKTCMELKKSCGIEEDI